MSSSDVKIGSNNKSFVPIRNITNNFTADITHRLNFDVNDTVEAYAVPIIFGIIFIVGIVGNGIVIFIVARNKIMRIAPNILIVSLSVGDLLLIVMSVPFSASLYIFKSWPFGQAICKFNCYMQTMSLGVSAFSLTALSADRYMAIVHPMRQSTGKTTSRVLAFVGIIWGISTVLAIPVAVSGNIYVVELNTNHYGYACLHYPVEHIEYGKTISLMQFIMFLAIPVLTIAFFYVSIAVSIVRSGHTMLCEGSKGTCVVNLQRQMAARKRVACIVLSFVMLFLICWLPRHVYLLWFFWDEDNGYNYFWHVFSIFGFCLAYLNSCVNPIALYFLSSQFRKYYNRYLFCR